MAQSIHCAKCECLILMVTGDGWVEDGWATCPDCMVDTRIVDAKQTRETRATIKEAA